MSRLDKNAQAAVNSAVQQMQELGLFEKKPHEPCLIRVKGIFKERAYDVFRELHPYCHRYWSNLK